MYSMMPRKSRRRSKPSGGSDGPEESTDKICQEIGKRVPSSSSNIQKPVITKRQTRGSSAKSVGQDSNTKSNTDNKLRSLLKKPGIQEILSAYSGSSSSTSHLSNFKIPRKKSYSSTSNDDTGLKTSGLGKASSSPKKYANQPLPEAKVQHEKKTCKRKAEAIGQTEQTTQSAKRCFSGGEVAKGKTNIPETVDNQATNINFCETNALRPLMKAKRTQPSPVPPPPASTTPAPVDTPQMKQLKALIASRKKKEVRKEKKRLSTPTPPTVYTQLQPQPLTSTPSRTNNNSIDKFCLQRSSESPKARFSETHATNLEKNVISEVTQIGRNDGTASYVHFDTTDAMDVDLVHAASTTATAKKLMIIVDTNVWIDHQLLIRELLDVDFQVLTASIKATVIIPWMVLQEIDHQLKKKSNKVAEFRGASKFIYNLLSSKQSQVKGEKAADAIIGNSFNESVNDDSILNCAIKCSKLTNVKTVFLTNDINLLNKALVHGLAAFKANSELINNIRQCLSDNSDSYSQIIGDPEETGNTSVEQLNAFSPNSFIASRFQVANDSFTSNCQVRESTSLEDFAMDIDDPMGMDDSEPPVSEINASKTEEICPDPTQNQFSSLPQTDPPTFEAVATAVQQSLTSIIVPKMVEEYGQDGWKFAIKIKPPFTVESALKCIQAHWIAVFSYMFSSRSKDAVDELVKKFHQKPTSLNSGDFKAWRLTISQLTLALLSRNDNISERPRVADCCRLLQAYIQVESNNST